MIITISFREEDGAHYAKLEESDPENPLEGKSEESRGAALVDLAEQIKAGAFNLEE